MIGFITNNYAFKSSFYARWCLFDYKRKISYKIFENNIFVCILNLDTRILTSKEYITKRSLCPFSIKNVIFFCFNP